MSSFTYLSNNKTTMMVKIDIEVLLSDEIPSNLKIHCTLDNDSRLGENCGLLNVVNETMTCRLVQCVQIHPYVCFQYEKYTTINGIEAVSTGKQL